MAFLKFNIVAQSEEQSTSVSEKEILINEQHLISLRPIKISVNGSVQTGFWLRLTNGKKYRATAIPKCLAKVFIDEGELVSFEEDNESQSEFLSLH